MDEEATTEQQEETEASVVEEAELSTDESPSGLAMLVVKRHGELSEDVFPLGEQNTIGRFDPSVGPIDVDLGNIPEGSYVSRKHARIWIEDDVWHIEDLGSSNGTYVLKNDFERIDTAEITDGTEIALGNARLVFHTN